MMVKDARINAASNALETCRILIETAENALIAATMRTADDAIDINGFGRCESILRVQRINLHLSILRETEKNLKERLSKVRVVRD